MRRETKRLAGLLEAARKDAKRSNFKEFFRTQGGGQTILCESRGERDFWEGYCKAIDEGVIKPEELSIQEIFESFIPDGRMICDDWRRGGSISLLEAAGAVSVSHFSNITGQIVYNKVLEGFNTEQFIFKNLIPTVTTQFSGERIPGISGLGDMAEVVGEGQLFPSAQVSEDYIDTPATLKRGFMVAVTKEAIFFDRTNLVLQRAAAVGEAMGANREIRAIDCVIDENTTAHRYKWKGTSYATYQGTTPWINSKTSNALENWTNIDALEQLFANMTDPYTGFPITIMPTHLFVTPQNSANARRILYASQTIRVTGGYPTTGNLNQAVAPNPVGNTPYSSPYTLVDNSRFLPTRLATDTDFFMNNPSKAFAYMENWPLAVVQAPPNSTAEFERDIVTQYRGSERGAYAVLEPRYAGKSAQ